MIHSYNFLADASFLNIQQLSNMSKESRLTINGTTLLNLLVPRVSGSKGNKQVQKFIIDTLTDLNWHVEQDTFFEITPQPHGEIEFTNIIATKHTYATRKLVIAAHFDSKFFLNQEFNYIFIRNSI